MLTEPPRSADDHDVPAFVAVYSQVSGNAFVLAHHTGDWRDAANPLDDLVVSLCRLII